MKKMILVVKKMICGFMLLYTYNVIAMPLNVIIGINYTSVGITSLFGIPGLIMLICLGFYF